MNKIDTIVFDLGNVLIRWDPYPVLLKAFNNEDIKTRWFLDNICHMEWNTTLDTGIRFDDAKKQRIAEYPEYEEYIAIYLDKWEEMLQGAIDGTLDILKKLKESGKYKLFAITNWSAEKFPVARQKYSFLSWFDDIVVSGEIGIVKPDRRIYKYAIDRFNLQQPESALFIDDRMENIEAAGEFGIKGIHFRDPQQLAAELRSFGINLSSNHRNSYSS